MVIYDFFKRVISFIFDIIIILFLLSLPPLQTITFLHSFLLVFKVMTRFFINRFYIHIRMHVYFPKHASKTCTVCIMLHIYMFSKMTIWYWITNCYALPWERLFLPFSALMATIIFRLQLPQIVWLSCLLHFQLNQSYRLYFLQYFNVWLFYCVGKLRWHFKITHNYFISILKSKLYI